MLRSGPILSLLVLPLHTGCFDDCHENHLLIDVHVDESIEYPASGRYAMAGVLVHNEYDYDEVEVDGDGIPTDPNGMGTLRGISAWDEEDGRDLYVDWTEADANEYWVWAFLDENNNSELDSGESFGIAPSNPYSGNCDSFDISITIDATY